MLGCIQGRCLGAGPSKKNDRTDNIPEHLGHTSLELGNAEKNTTAIMSMEYGDSYVYPAFMVCSEEGRIAAQSDNLELTSSRALY